MAVIITNKPGSSTSSAALSVVNKTASYTAATTDNLIIYDTSGGAATLTLPTAVSNTGIVIRTVLKTAGNILTINTTSSQTIGGEASGAWKLGTVKDSITVVSDGSNWQILEENICMSIRYTNLAADSVPVGIYGYGNKLYDALSLYAPMTTGAYTAPVSGKYEITASMFGVNGGYLYIYVNGTMTKQGMVVDNITTPADAAFVAETIQLVAGDIFTIQSDVAGTTNSNQNLTTFAVNRVAN